jgi:hypothetical protein
LDGLIVDATMMSAPTPKNGTAVALTTLELWLVQANLSSKYLY